MKKGFCVLGILIGVLSIILAVNCFNRSTGLYESNKIYGGDAYTGIQNASAQTSNNIQCLAEITRFAGGSTLLVFGLLSIAYFGMKCFDDKHGGNIDSNNTSISSFKNENNNGSSQAYGSINAETTETPKPVFKNINTESIETPKPVKKERVPSENEWKCPKCGKINQNYVGTCGCGEMKPR